MAFQPLLLLSDQFSVIKPLGFKYWSRFCFVVRTGWIPPSTSQSLGVRCQLLRICYHLFFSFFGLSFWSLKVLPQCVFYPGWMCLQLPSLGNWNLVINPASPSPGICISEALLLVSLLYSFNIALTPLCLKWFIKWLLVTPFVYLLAWLFINPICFVTD